MHPSCTAPTALLLLALGTTAWADILDVPGEVSSIEEALALAVPGDTVRVAPGSYVGSFEMTGPDVWLLGAEGPEVTRLIGPSTGTRVVNIVNSVGLRGVEGFTLATGRYAIQARGGAVVVRNCRIEDVERGIEIHADTLVVEDTRFRRTTRQAVDVGTGTLVRFRRNVFARCAPRSGPVVLLEDGVTGKIESSTFFGNVVDGGAAVHVPAGVELERTIIAFTEGGAGLSAAEGAFVAASENCLFANETGATTFPIPSSSGWKNNFSADPRFCRPEAYTFTLADDSPCLDGPGGDRIGAFGTGCAAPTPPEVWEVDDAAGLVEALAQAAYADTIDVAAGEYVGTFHLPVGRVLRGAGAGETILDADALGTPLTVGYGDLHTRMSGLTLRGGVAESGAGLRLDAGQLEASNLHVRENVAEGTFPGGYGGGIQVAAGILTLTDGVVADNQAAAGGGIAVMPSARVFLDGVTLADNVATTFGGGLLLADGVAEAAFCTVARNHAGVGGGGVYADPGFIFADRCTVADNTTDDGYGAATYGGGWWRTSVFVHDGTDPLAYTTRIYDLAITDGCVYVPNGPILAGPGGEEDVVDAILADPLFCDHVGGDYRLQPGSPCDTDDGFIGRFEVGCDDPRSDPHPVAVAPSFRVYPSPSRGPLTIVGGTGDVTATVYDVRGRRVQRLASRTGRIRWDGRTASGRDVPAGVYLVEVVASSGRERRKVVIE